jgi:hypothetical protein
MRNRVALFAVILSVASGLAACGGDDNGSPGTDSGADGTVAEGGTDAGADVTIADADAGDASTADAGDADAAVEDAGDALPDVESGAADGGDASDASDAGDAPADAPADGG